METEKELRGKISNLLNLFIQYWDYAEHSGQEPFPSEVGRLEKQYETYIDELVEEYTSQPQVSEEEIEKIAREIATKQGGGLYGDWYTAAKLGAKAALQLSPPDKPTEEDKAKESRCDECRFRHDCKFEFKDSVNNPCRFFTDKNYNCEDGTR